MNDLPLPLIKVASFWTKENSGLAVEYQLLLPAEQSGGIIQTSCGIEKLFFSKDLTVKLPEGIVIGQIKERTCIDRLCRVLYFDSHYGGLFDELCLPYHNKKSLFKLKVEVFKACYRLKAVRAPVSKSHQQK